MLLLACLALLSLAGQTLADDVQTVYASPGQRTVVSFDFTTSLSDAGKQADNPFAGAKKLPIGRQCPCGCDAPCSCETCPAYQVASADTWQQVCDGKTCKWVKMPGKAPSVAPAASVPINSPSAALCGVTSSCASSGGRRHPVRHFVGRLFHRGR